MVSLYAVAILAVPRLLASQHFPSAPVTVWYTVVSGDRPVTVEVPHVKEVIIGVEAYATLFATKAGLKTAPVHFTVVVLSQ